ncbi:hybrid sensor histidine kinase/response regulator [Pseudoalteromonas luteoviolacea]|uniref:Sensory/regulatory protein RpfC n=1 Tax=Pseudoalteromonas luteoviolacea TaxID=43657 RepID=A0A1C0TP61_9GAMM|nr:ATP-binding protein [Pseudoalteromonas luteoviolacea]MBQ4814472.1 response regulator [Pseudoalteromonas luteoviolacea]OCQ20510.1 hybrid sensor histidine kinase/response regulator [Pseudoalteromonas luteoviolacea]
MENSSQAQIKGFVPLFVFVTLIIASVSALAAYLWPKQIQTTTHSQPDLVLQAQDLAAPLSNTMMKLGYNYAKQMLTSVKAGNPDINAYLYADSGMGKPSLVFQTDEFPVAPVKQRTKLTVNDQTIVHQPLTLDDMPVGELILVYTEPQVAAPEDNPLSYLLALIALILTVAFALFLKKQVVGKLAKELKLLNSELEHLVAQKDYEVHITENLSFGLSQTSIGINALINQIRDIIKGNQAAQNELRQLQTSLETEVQARTLALEKATLNAERASEAKTTFLATMSHEIRTPMNGVIGTIDLLRQTELDGAQHRLTTIIRDSAFSLLGILDDILDFSKIEAGKLQIDSSAFSVSETIEEVARVLSSVAKKRKLDLQLAIAPDIPSNLVGDAVRVRQVLYNLCSNAIKFTSTDESRQGFVKISVEVAQNTSEHYTLRFKVTDNGKGMTQAQLREIFNPFIQAEGSITREYGGTGLGLSICKSLVELMLGSINVQSDIGMGSEFVVELPFSITGKVEYANKGVLEGRKIVTFTHNPNRRAILARYLSFMGANSVVVLDASEMGEHQYEQDVVWVLDGLDGMDKVNQQLRDLLYSLEHNNQQVIVLSTMDESALNHGHIFYLNAAPLCKTSFMTAVLVAVGLHKPKQLKPSRSMNSYLNTEDAKAENKLVLLVEDNVLNQQVLTDQLHLLGYGVEVAENGEEGLKMWQKGHYAVVLTDLHMPKMSGYDMVTKIRDIAEQAPDINAQPYIIAITANALKGERDRCLASGMNDYITKPVELNVLEATLDKWQETTGTKVGKSAEPQPTSSVPIQPEAHVAPQVHLEPHAETSMSPDSVYSEARQITDKAISIESNYDNDINEPETYAPLASQATPEIEVPSYEPPLQEQVDTPIVEEAPVEDTQAPETPINMDQLNKYVNDDDAKRLRFFRMYLEQSSELARDINGAVISSSQSEIIEACHQLKSISRTIGAEQVALLAEGFETRCKEEELSSDQLIQLRDELEQAYQNATEFIQQFLQQSAN